MKQRNNWWVTILQGIIAVVLGIYLLIGGVQAAGIFALVAAGYMLITGIFDMLRGREHSIVFYRSIASIVTGGVLLFLYAVDLLPTSTDFTIFAIGVIIVGAMGLFTSFFQRAGRPFSWGPVLINLLLLIWGVLIFVARVQESDLQLISGWILIGIGAVLVLWGFLTRGRGAANEAL